MWGSWVRNGHKSKQNKKAVGLWNCQFDTAEMELMSMLPFKNVAPGVNVGPTWFSGNWPQTWRPNLLESAGLLVGIYRRGPIYIDVPPQLLMVWDEQFTVAAIAHDIGMPKWTTCYKSFKWWCDNSLIMDFEWFWYVLHCSWWDFFRRNSWISIWNRTFKGDIQILYAGVNFGVEWISNDLHPQNFRMEPEHDAL